MASFIEVPRRCGAAGARREWRERTRRGEHLSRGHARYRRRPAPAEVTTVDNWALAAIVAVLTLLVAPVWPWSRGWTWAPAGMFATGLATVLLFTFAVVPE
jgi:hypothetical protein